MKIVPMLTFVALLFVSVVHDSVAHGILEDRLAPVNERIEAEPKNPELYLERGVIYLLYGSWDKAILDFDTIRELAPREFDVVDLFKARALLASARSTQNEKLQKQQLEEALALIDIYEHAEADNFDNHDVHLYRARVLAQLGRYNEATLSHELLISEFKLSPSPDFYTLHADWLIKDNNRVEDALVFLDKGINKGHRVVLQEKAIDIELSRNGVDAAIARMDKLIEGAHHKQTYQTRKADLLFSVGREKEAERVYEEAKASLAALGSRLQPSPMTLELKDHVESRLTDIKTR